MQAFISILFSAITLGLLGASFWYVPFRLTRLLELSNARLITWVFIGAMAASLVCMIAFNHSSSSFLGLLSTTAGLIFGVHLFLLLLLLFFDLVRMLIPISGLATAWTALSFSLLLVIWGSLNANSFEVTRHELMLSGLQEDVRIMHISDVHIGHHRGRSYLEQIVAETNAHHPDLVLINGDLVDANSVLKPDILAPLADFQAPVFFTTGNHENYVHFDKALEIVQSLGVRVLRNQIVRVEGIQLIGLDYMNADEHTYDAHSVNSLTIKEELPKIKIGNDAPTVLMHHSPVGLEYITQAGIDLMLAGHTHAGQVFPATLITPLMFPLNKGFHDIDGTLFFVSQGAGTFGPRLRIGSQNEINLIDLKRN